MKADNLLAVQKTTLSILVLLLVISAGLINADYFYQSASIAYYGFGVTALIFTITPPSFLFS